MALPQIKSLDSNVIQLNNKDSGYSMCQIMAVWLQFHAKSPFWNVLLTYRGVPVETRHRFRLMALMKLIGRLKKNLSLFLIFTSSGIIKLARRIYFVLCVAK